MRGSVAATRRSKNSYMTSLRRVTKQPTGWCSRNLKFAMLLRDLVMTGLRPVIMERSRAASSTAPFSSDALTPMLMTIFSIRGTWCTFLYFRFSIRAGTTSFTYLSYSLAFIFLRLGFCRSRYVRLKSLFFRCRRSRLALRRAFIISRGLHHIRDVNGAFPLDNRSLRMRLALAGVALDHLRAFDD